MNDRTITVTEAARHFADLVNRTYYRGETTVMVRGGEPVAMVAPVAGVSVLGCDWLAKWHALPHLPAEDAADFADCIENARNSLTPPATPWE